ncbi:hypothetical protein [Rhizobium sp.]|uniref:hypothetical protein n=1 Tax=Rhizobium sp. TaxID=391 RepID=UPI002F012048
MKILPETIRERFNLSDLSTDYFDLFRLECAPFPAAPASKIDWAPSAAGGLE